ncbi:MAG TPA: hypothetical protein VMF89_21820, partial [Polyangiales bacterium]|nr:hypothetical protein [Polyangiales bacterium]
RLSGTIGDIYPDAHARVQYSELGSRHELRQFIRYIVLGCLADQKPGLELPPRSVLVARKGAVACFELTTAECVATMRELLELYVEAYQRPLPLFAHASLCYAEKLRKGGDEQAALRAARYEYGDRSGRPGLGKDLPDPYVEQLFGDFDQMVGLVGEGFGMTTMRLYGPLLQARRAG